MSRVEDKPILKKIGRFFWFFFFSALIIATSVLVYEEGPNKYQYTDDSFNFKYSVPEINKTEYNVIFDAHSHTYYSDGVLSPRQNILWHIAHGFNAIASTDHHTIEGAIAMQKIAREEFAGEFVVLIGTEWTSNRIHMNLIGISELIKAPSNPTDLQIQEAINKTHEQGGIVIVNHIPWTMARTDSHPTRQQLLDWGVDYIEIVNEYDYDSESVAWCNNSGGFGMITGSDMHSPMDIKAWTGMKVTNFTEEAILNELKARRTTIFYNETGGSIDQSTKTENPTYQALEPLMLLGSMFETYYPGYIDWPGIGVFVLYLVGVFVIAEFIRVGNRKFWEKINKDKGRNE